MDHLHQLGADEHPGLVYLTILCLLNSPLLNPSFRHLVFSPKTCYNEYTKDLLEEGMPMDTPVNRKYKDRLFRFLFGTEERKSNLLSLYNVSAK